VSEERGTISVCFNGNLIPNLDGASLRRALAGLFGEEAKRKTMRRTTKSSQSGLPRTGAPTDRTSEQHKRISIHSPAQPLAAIAGATAPELRSATTAERYPTLVQKPLDALALHTAPVQIRETPAPESAPLLPDEDLSVPMAEATIEPLSSPALSEALYAVGLQSAQPAARVVSDAAASAAADSSAPQAAATPLALQPALVPSATLLAGPPAELDEVHATARKAT
jgi:diadenylate cyclase